MEIGIAFIVLAGFVLINIIYHFFLARVGFYKTTQQVKSQDAVSIIVCSKNEQENLKTLVPLLLQQNHPNFEIILINDASIDNTLEVIEEFQAIDDRVKKVDVVNNESFWGNKKYALTLGIKKAINDKLIFIDADCKPASNSWLQIMADGFAENKSIILGYGAYEKKKYSILNALIRYETGITAIQYMSYALHGNPYMGVGRNLAYTSKQFYDVSGFIDHMKVLGGDDDLFVNQAATKDNTTVIIEPDAFTISKPKNTWSNWWTQKRRHINTASHYKAKHKFLLSLYFISQIGFLTAAILGFIIGMNWMFILGLVLLRYLIVWLVIGKGLSRFRESDIIPFIPLLEIILIFTQLGLFLANAGKQPKRWK
ncbi:glycosyl transferase family 2 [Nonlabens arenilitoris]|uniref:Glycosyl transferase family 2 n=1 Tax=Nonlabens arenilitoris TaxID=1217969 RepID=A0A2S7U783_9FLAO|nr:glycosyltransferase [Nonlabens arenilitoris]PQJ30859.1 glycosyl transferase family 2 [Nonlabens arenilitoris]